MVSPAETLADLQHEIGVHLGSEGDEARDPVVIYTEAVAALEAQRREIDDLRAFIRGAAINMENVLK